MDSACLARSLAFNGLARPTTTDPLCRDHAGIQVGCRARGPLMALLTPSLRRTRCAARKLHRNAEMH